MSETPSLSATIKQLRERAKLSQVDAAALIGVHPVQLSKWERGVNVPGGENLAAIAAAYRVSMDALMAGGAAGETEASELPRESKPDHSVQTPAALPAYPPELLALTVPVPALLLAEMRGQLYAEVRHLGRTTDTVRSIVQTLEDLTRGFSAVASSGVFPEIPPVEHVRAPTVEDIVASWTPAEIQRAFAAVEEANAARAALDARLAQQPPSDRGAPAASPPPPPAEAAPARRRRTG